jgi:hypothetical protein
MSFSVIVASSFQRNALSLKGYLNFKGVLLIGSLDSFIQLICYFVEFLISFSEAPCW